MSKRILTAAWILPAGLLCFWATEARATHVEFALSGTIYEVDDAGDVVYGGEFQVGMPFTGTVGWDTDLVDTSLTAGLGYYRTDPAMGQISLSMSLAGEQFANDPSGLAVMGVFDDGPAGDRVQIDGSPGVSTGPPVSIIEMVLLSGSTSPLSGTAPPTSLDVSDWPLTHYLAFDGSKGGSLGFVFGAIETIAQVPGPSTQVPEPSAAFLFGLGSAGLAWWLQKRR